MQRRRLSSTAKRNLLTRLIMPAALALHAFPVFADWRDLKALKEELGELNAELAAMDAAAKAENRALNEDELTRVNQLTGSEDSPGEIERLQARIKSQEAIEAAKNRFTNPAGGDALPPTGGDNDPNTDPQNSENRGIVARTTVPARAYRPRLAAVKCFETAEDNHRAAYGLGRFALAAIAKHRESIEWCETNGIKAGLTEGTPADGGFTVPSELSRSIEWVRDEHGVYRNNASIEPMMADTKDVAEQISGMPWFFIGEATAITDTGTPQFKNIALVAKKAATIGRMSSEVSDDSVISLGDRLALSIGVALANCEDTVGFLGDGTATHGSMTGIIPALVGKKGMFKPGRATLADITNADYRKMISLVPGRYRRAGMGCAWYVNSTVWDATMGLILDAAGGNSQQDLENGPGRLRFKGYPVIETQVLMEAEDEAATERPIIFGNLSAGAKFGDRRGIRISRSDQVYWTTDELGVKGTQRFHANNHAVGDATNVEAFVVFELGV